MLIEVHKFHSSKFNGTYVRFLLKPFSVSMLGIFLGFNAIFLLVIFSL